MCTIEWYNLVFPGGHTERRYSVVNCAFGTPNNPCTRRRQETQLFHDRQATEEDIAEYARTNALTIQPRPYSSSGAEPIHTQESGLAKRKNHKGVLSGFELEFKFRNPFSAKKKEKKKGKGNQMATQPTYQTNTSLQPVETMPLAPSPPPAFGDPHPRPKVIEISPQKEPESEPEKHHKKRRPSKKHHKKPIVEIHQDRKDRKDRKSDESISEEGSEDSLPLPTRRHHHPRPRSLSPATKAEAAAEKADHERRERDIRNKEAERDARERARQQHEDEIRREERRKREQRRSQQNSPETAEEYARRQYEIDSKIIRAERHQDSRRGGSTQLTPHIIHRHRRNASFEDSGSDFIEGAVADAMQRRGSSNTSNDGSHHSSNRSHDRRRHEGSH